MEGASTLGFQGEFTDGQTERQTGMTKSMLLGASPTKGGSANRMPANLSDLRTDPAEGSADLPC